MSDLIYTSVHSSMRSGLTGGAATGRGVEYQTWYAVHVAMKLIARLLCESPIQRPMLVIEPRILTSNSLTRWDLQVTPDNLAVEAKARLSKPDLVQLLERCRESTPSAGTQKVELVYGESTTSFLRSIEKLIRLATECGENTEEFDKRCVLEFDDEFGELLTILGSAALLVGRRLLLKLMPEHLIHDSIDCYLQFFVQPNQRTHVRNTLCSKFMSAMSKREAFFIAELLGDFKKEGIEFGSRLPLVPEELDESIHKSIYLLQRCDQGLPIQVLAGVNNSVASRLAEEFRQSQAVAVDANDICTASPLCARLHHPDAPHVLSKGLTAVIQFIQENRRNGDGHLQVCNALALTRECAEVNPAAATLYFGPLDKLLKRSGQKRLVLEMAEITIRAARSVSPPTESVRKAEAKALICGKAWVCQRVGRLDDADAVANESLELGKALNWKRNTAYCLKCMGRLRRIRAENEANPKKRTKYLGESRKLLLEAIGEFQGCDELEAIQRQEEIGDCHSLVGRTQYLAGRIDDAEYHAGLARGLITCSLGYEGSKDYMDLLILEAQLHGKRFEYSKADEKLVEAIGLISPNDAEKSEIVARAHLTRGRNLFQWKNDKLGAIDEIQKAIAIWDLLDEHCSKGYAEWVKIEIEGEVSKQDKIRFKPIEYSVRVEMVRLIRAQRFASNARSLSQRADLDDTAWQNLLAEAKRNDAIRHRRW